MSFNWVIFGNFRARVFIIKAFYNGEFPGGPVIKSPRASIAGGLGSIPGRGTKISQAARKNQKKKKKKKAAFYNVPRYE